VLTQANINQSNIKQNSSVKEKFHGNVTLHFAENWVSCGATMSEFGSYRQQTFLSVWNCPGGRRLEWKFHVRTHRGVLASGIYD